MRRARGGTLACVAVLALASCAPRPTGVAPVDAGGREALYRSRLLGREERSRMAVGEATLWPRGLAPCDTCAPVRLPAVRAEVAVLAPESVRLSVRSAFGTAADVGLRGDSIVAYAPGLGLGVMLDAVRDSFGPAGPGRLAARLVAAAWRPPEGAPAPGDWEDGRLVLRWLEGGDSVTVAVDGGGLPARVRLRPAAGGEVRVRYERWEVIGGVAWPMAWTLETGDGGPGLGCRMERVSFAGRPDPERLRVRVPADAERVGPDEVRRLLGAVAGSR